MLLQLLFAYNGEAKKPTVTVKDSKGNTLKKDTDYTVTYASGRKAVGSYKVTVKGTGKYSFTKTLTFKINPAKAKLTSVTSKSAGTMLVKWNKMSGVTGYQIKYTVGDTTKTVKVAKASTVSKTIKSLKKGKRYTVSIRSYKTVNDTTYYSAYSSTKDVTVAKLKHTPVYHFQQQTVSGLSAVRSGSLIIHARYTVTVRWVLDANNDANTILWLRRYSHHY